MTLNHDTKQLYQRIYEENEWYADGHQNRSPGVRLLPKYQDWLISPVLDLGCGRGHAVEKLQSAGFQAEGIDQIEINDQMRVGDISKPVSDVGKFNSVVCIDCIEHMNDDQVLGLFANMKKVKHQAFSIHNGESTGTGQELHVNRKPFDQWYELIDQHFDIEEVIEIHPMQMLYLTSRKASKWSLRKLWRRVA